MKAPKAFKYSLNGIKVVAVEEGKELKGADLAAAKKIGIVEASKKAPSGDD